MRFCLFIGAVLLIVLVAACQTVPPITYIMEVTREVTVVVTPNGMGTLPAIAGTPNATGTFLAQNTPTATASEPTQTPTPTLSPTVDVFPTPVVGQIFVAEQTFEAGHLFWLQPVGQIWVATTDENGNNIWSVYADTFQEGQPENNPTLTPPAGLYQPERGFGKLWRETAEVQALLGWAVEPEFGYITRYEYRAGGSVDANNRYVSGPGRHVVTLLTGEIIVFIEGENRTWEITTPES